MSRRIACENRHPCLGILAPLADLGKGSSSPNRSCVLTMGARTSTGSTQMISFFRQTRIKGHYVAHRDTRRPLRPRGPILVFLQAPDCALDSLATVQKRGEIGLK